MSHLEAFLEVDTNGKYTRKSTSAAQWGTGHPEALVGLRPGHPCGQTSWGALSSALHCSPPSAVHLSLSPVGREGPRALDKRRWTVKTVLPLLPLPASSPLQRTSQRAVPFWSGIEMSSEHTVLIKTQPCSSVPGAVSARPALGDGGTMVFCGYWFVFKAHANGISTPTAETEVEMISVNS